MQFGTINGNAYRCYEMAMSFMVYNEQPIEEFIRVLQAARIIRIRNVLLLIDPDSYFVEPLDGFGPGDLHYYAGSGIEIAAGLQQSTGSK